MVKAQGQRLRLHNPTPLALPFAVRLQSTTGQCWESEFDTDGVIANAVDRFKGLGD